MTNRVPLQDFSRIEVPAYAGNFGGAILNWITIVFFFLFIVVPGGIGLTGVLNWPVHENRAPTPWPAFPNDVRSAAAFPRQVSAYINGHFGLRGVMITANSLARYKIGVSSVNNVVFGRDGWLFYAYNFEQLLQQHTGQNIFKGPADVDRWIDTLEAVQTWMNRRNIAFYIAVAPDKPTIYPELLPAYPTGSTTRLDQIVTRLRERGSPLEFVDVRAALLQEKKFHRVYNKRDSHWNQRGSLVAYSELMKRIQRRFPNVPALTIDDYDLVTMPDPSDLAWHLNLLDLYPYIPSYPPVPLPPRWTLMGDETVEGLRRRSPSHVLGSELVAPKAGASWGWHVNYYKTDLTDRPRAVVFADSFTDFIMGPTALYQTFRDVVYTHNNGAALNFKLVEEVQPDLVIVVMAERYLQSEPLRPPAP